VSITVNHIGPDSERVFVTSRVADIDYDEVRSSSPANIAIAAAKAAGGPVTSARRRNQAMRRLSGSGRWHPAVVAVDGHQSKSRSSCMRTHFS
jgi:hypothetical protein